jgi:hypothetical protein
MAWHSYHRARIKEKQSQKKHFEAQDQFFVLIKNLTNQLVLIAKGILKLNNSQRKIIGR